MSERNNYVLCSVCKYDNGTMSVQPLQRGDRESCERVATMISAISHSGPKRPIESYLTLLDADDFDKAMDEEGSPPRSPRSEP